MIPIKVDSADVKAPLVSVVITCYNYGKYLAGCVESVLGQTYEDVDITIVNDGSTDETDCVVQELLPHEKISYIKQDNAGQANAKNTGIRNSKGQYVAFLDADDLWEKDKLEKQMALFSSDSVGVVFSRFRCIDEKGLDIDVEPPAGYLSPRRGKVTNFLYLDNFVPFSSSVIRRECLSKFGGFDESLKMAIDWDLWLRISTQYEFDYIDEPLLIYRLGHAGQMSKNREERERCSDRIMHHFLERFPGVVPMRVQKAAFAYTCCNKGHSLSNKERVESFKMFIRAIKHTPFSSVPYRGLIRTLAGWTLRKQGRKQKG